MRIERYTNARPLVPVVPFLSLALIVGASVILTGMYSASRGPALRFATNAHDGALPDADAVRVEVSAEQEAVIDGFVVPFDRLASEVESRLSSRPDAPVVLAVSPEASYETLVAAYGAIAGLPHPPRIAIPALPQRIR